MNITITINQIYKSIPKGLQFQIPKFCILTGKNGSGKSHLLEAIANASIAQVLIDGKQVTKIHHVGFNGLNPTVDEQCDRNTVIANVNQKWSEINGIITNYKQEKQRGAVYDDLSQYLRRFGHNPARDSVITQVLTKSGRSFEEITEDDVLDNISFTDMTENQLFFSQCAMIFKLYHTRLIKNEFAEFRAKKKESSDIDFMSSEEFLHKYGPPPWDLINDILKRANLPYEVASPDISDFDLPYRLRLVDKDKGIDISVNDLSSGEKVLMSLALAIYNTQEGGSKPELLLLDEPDAPLHPQFSKLLIDTLIETIVEKAGVNVLLTTHSPSTVAMAPDFCVYEIQRDTKEPKLVSNTYAVNILTSGVAFLRVEYQKRKQIFVESKYDVQYFQRLYNLLNRKYNFTYDPVFLEPHSGSSNCSDVISLVDKLRNNGSDIVYGIIDYDNSNISNEHVIVLGNGQRYAIENYILDPIYIALSLIRYGKKTFTNFGITSKTVYTESTVLTQEECQLLASNFMKDMGFDTNESITCTLENGYIIEYPKSFLFHHGHEYEIMLQEKHPELQSISKGQGDSALKLGILQVIEELPHYLPKDLLGTLATILGPVNDK